MSSLHFTSTEEYRRRVIQLGEQPERVFYVGAMGVENLKKVPLMRKLELEDSLNFKFEGLSVLVTYHPVTLGIVILTNMKFSDLLKALDSFSSFEGFVYYAKFRPRRRGNTIGHRSVLCPE